ncbi:MAG TPA: pyruvate kinase, partial [Chloroflexota bacterium]|nr:pyruvate kinase [Chloroflexota bacterium]
MSRTRIVATLGPATDPPDVLRDLLAAGVDVVRLNTAHGTQEDHQRRLDAARAAAHELGRPLASLLDLQGPKVRLGHIPAPGIPLHPEAQVILSSRPDATA